MSAIASAIEVNLKHITEMNETLDNTIWTIDTQIGKLKEQEQTQKAAYEAEQKRNEEMWAAYNA